MSFQWLMQLNRSREETLHDCRAFRKSFVHLALLSDAWFGKVRLVVPNAGRSFIFGVLFTNNKRELFGIDFDRPQGIKTRLFGCARNPREFFAVIADGSFTFAVQNGGLDPRDL